MTCIVLGHKEVWIRAGTECASPESQSGISAMESFPCAQVWDQFALFASFIAVALVFVFIFQCSHSYMATIPPLNPTVVCMDYLRLPRWPFGCPSRHLVQRLPVRTKMETTITLTLGVLSRSKTHPCSLQGSWTR